MKQELKQHLLPLLAVFIITSGFWVFSRTSVFQFVYLFFGLLWGAFFLDLDHLIFWFYLKPNIEESRLAQVALSKRDFWSLIKLLESTHKNHTSLIFHHYFFQVVLALISLFVFTSSNSTFAMGFLIALNAHLLIDELNDLKTNPKHLQNWLFAREEKQLSMQYLNHYVYIFAFLLVIFEFLLIRSHL